MDAEKKTVRVAAAAILHEGRVLACQRGYGPLTGRWELPGGKIEQDETGEEAVRREIREELSMEICPRKALCKVEYAYPTFYLYMEVFLCSPGSKAPALTEHQSARWVAPEALEELPWCPADALVLPALREIMQKETK